MVRRRSERKRVSSANRPPVSKSMSPRSSQMQKVEPSRIPSRGPSGTAKDPRGGRLRERLHDDLVHVHMLRPRKGEEDALGDVVGRQRLDVGVHLLGFFRVAAKTNLREVRLDEAGIDGGQVD